MKKTMIKKVSILVLLFSILQVQKADTTEVITKNQKEMLDKYDYEVVVVDKIEDTHNWGFSPAGLCDSVTKKITIDSAYVDYAFSHEYGHFIDYINEKPSDSESFKEIYKSEKDNFTNRTTEYSRSTSQEYFASAYKTFLEEPKNLESMCPQTYNFIKNIK